MKIDKEKLAILKQVYRPELVHTKRKLQIWNLQNNTEYNLEDIYIYHHEGDMYPFLSDSFKFEKIDEEFKKYQQLTEWANSFLTSNQFEILQNHSDPATNSIYEIYVRSKEPNENGSKDGYFSVKDDELMIDKLWEEFQEKFDYEDPTIMFLVIQKALQSIDVVCVI